MADLDLPVGAAIDLGRALGEVMQARRDGADLPFRRALVNYGHEDEPRAELRTQSACHARRPFRRLRVVDSADDRSSHQILL